MSDYTPDEIELIGCYAGAMEDAAGQNYNQAKADAERGIEAIKTKARAEALREWAVLLDSSQWALAPARSYAEAARRLAHHLEKEA